MEKFYYKGLYGSTHQFKREKLYYGSVLNVTPKQLYESETFSELEDSFREAVDDCIKRGDVLTMKRKYPKSHWEENMKFVCDRDKVPYAIDEETESFIIVDITAKIDELEILEEDAMCEKQRNDAGSKIPVYSFRTLKNPEKKERLMKFYKRKGFIVYKPDEEKCRIACL